MDDADLELAAQAVAKSGLANAGQVCISAQRILTSQRIHGDFVDALQPIVSGVQPGNQMQPDSGMGPMVREEDARRVELWISEAVAGGATLVSGGKRDGSLFEPTILDDVSPDMKVSCDELFGPAVALSRFSSLDEAIHLANSTPYGLSAGIFTRDIDRALRFATEVDSGNLHVNWASQWRADLMPYGGLKDSGMGKEGPAYAIQEMTEEKMVILHSSQKVDR